jgi:hypothetical protein
VEELVGRQLRCQNLKQEEIGVDHGLAEVTLDVGHRLTFDLEAVADPKAAHNLVESSLKKKSICLATLLNITIIIIILIAIIM